jgi:serine/threonine protein kinase/tetratricopeptide (TPR) repeat protein
MGDLHGRTLGRYRIVERIGAGGMGEVYRARDERLDRDVAIKVLPEAVANDPERLKRFEREAKAVARLSHPNILEIFNFESGGDTTFAVTELLEGVTLSEKLWMTGGPLPWKQCREIGVAVAEGLGAAHGKGVVHRDIKPSNIFLCSDGRVKILDFGLAATREVLDAEAETGSIEAPLTREGSVMGTVGYMSPEQVRGESADARSDIFALGCVLYEMLSGTKAFQRGTSAEIMTAILREDPEPLADAGIDIDPGVESTVLRCLDKNPQRRFQSASDLAFALKQGSGPVRTPATPLKRRSSPFVRPLIVVAILVIGALAVRFVLTQRQRSVETAELDPKRVVIAEFENRTGDPSLDALGFLVSEAIAERASGIGDFTVVSALTSSNSRLGEGDSEPGDISLRDVARASGATIVVSGAYYLLGQDLRFQARMVDAATDAVLFEMPAVTGPRGSKHDVIKSVRQRVLGAVAWFFVTEQFDMTTPPLLDAFLEFRRGRELYMNHQQTDIRHFRRAVELDPNFGEAWMNLVLVHTNRRLCGEAGQILDEAEAHLGRFTQFERARFRWARAVQEWDHDARLRAANQIFAMTDGSNKYHVGLAEMFLNRPSAAIEVFAEIPYPSDPDPASVSEWRYWWMARAHHLLGDYSEELQVVHRTLPYFPSSRMMRVRQGAALAALGRLNEIETLKDELTLIQWDPVLKMRVFVELAAELRAHDLRDASRSMAQHALRYFDTRPAATQRELRFARADALIFAERWTEAKDAANTLLLDPWRDAEGRMVEEEERARGGFWWGDRGQVVALGRVGALAARLGESEEALQIDRRLETFDSSCPTGNRTFQRACIAAQLGDRDEAIRLLKEAIAQGYWGFWGMHSDIHLEPLWNDSRFLELIRPKG